MKLNDLSEKTIKGLSMPVDFSRLTIGGLAKVIIALKEAAEKIVPHSNGSLSEEDTEAIIFPLRLVCEVLRVDYACNRGQKTTIEAALKKCEKNLCAIIRLNLEVNKHTLARTEALKAVMKAADDYSPKKRRTP